MEDFVCVEETKIFNSFSSLGVTLLRESLKTLGSSHHDEELKEGLIKFLREDVIELGVEEIVCQLQRPTTEQICSFYNAKIESTEYDDGDFSYNQAERYWKESIRSSSLLQCVTELSDDLVQVILADLGIKWSTSEDSNRKLLYTEILLTGTEAFFTLLTHVLLKKYCHHFELSANGRKQELIERIIQSIIKSEADKPAVEEDVEENDDLLDKKILCGDAQLQRLLVKELRSFCQAHSMPYDGKKSELIKRIQDFIQNKENM